MDHPIIRKMERDGYLEVDEPIGYDHFGKPYFENDEVYKVDNEVFLEHELSQEAIEVLIFFGAKKVCATNTDN